MSDFYIVTLVDNTTEWKSKKFTFKWKTFRGTNYHRVWKLKDFSANQILREINFGPFEEPKSAILTILAALKFDFLAFSS